MSLAISGCGDLVAVEPIPSADKSDETAGAEWRIFRGDSRLSGVAPGALPDRLVRIWTYKTGSEIISSPVVGDGKVYVGTLDGSVVALTLESGELVWEHKTDDDSFEAPALLLDGAVIIGNLSGELLSLDAATGERQWTYTAEGKITGSANWLPAADGEQKRLYLGAHDNRLHCIDAATGAGIWSYDTKNFINGAPAVDGIGVVFGGCDSMLHRLSTADGSSMAEVNVGSYAAGSPAIAGGRAFVGTYDGYLVAVDLDRNRVAWEYDNEDGGAFFSSPAIVGDRVIAGARDLCVHCVSRATGKREWVFRTQGDVDSSPVVVGERVLFGSTDGRLYMIGLADGQLIWSYEVGSALIGTPAVAAGKVIVGAEDGGVYAFGEPTPDPDAIAR
jgi:outer membrane protein assembly factor BamB